MGGWAALEPNAASLAAGGYRVQAAGAGRHAVPLIQLLQGDLSTRAPGVHNTSACADHTR